MAESASESLVTLRELTVSYGPVVALDAVSLEIRPGTWGLLGPNGAGKTTLLRVLLGLLRPSVGHVSILGHDPRRHRGRLRIRRQVGYMPEGDCLLPGMNAVELVGVLARLSGLSRAEALMRTHEVLYYVGLEDARYRDVLGYSSGMKQRLKLAQALVHDPMLLLLDEPTNGLDPRGRDGMLELIADLGLGHRKSILVCSHLLPDVERTCEHVFVLNQGRLAGRDRIQALSEAQPLLWRVRVRDDLERLQTALGLHGLSGVRDTDGSLLVTQPDPTGSLDPLFGCAHQNGVVITSVESVRGSLEAWFLKCLDGTRAQHA